MSEKHQSNDRCPHCEKYIDFLLKDDADGFQREKIAKGFWASISGVHDEYRLMNKALTLEGALKMRLPITLDMQEGDATFGRFARVVIGEYLTQTKKEDELTGK